MLFPSGGKPGTYVPGSRVYIAVRKPGNAGNQVTTTFCAHVNAMIVVLKMSTVTGKQRLPILNPVAMTLLNDSVVNRGLDIIQSLALSHRGRTSWRRRTVTTCGTEPERPWLLSGTAMEPYGMVRVISTVGLAMECWLGFQLSLNTVKWYACINTWTNLNVCNLAIYFIICFICITFIYKLCGCGHMCVHLWSLVMLLSILIVATCPQPTS